MELEEVNAKYEALKKKYWKPEWDSMSEDEKFKDPIFATYLHEMLVVGLEYAKDQRTKCTEPLQRELINEFIKFYEKSLGNFRKIE